MPNPAEVNHLIKQFFNEDPIVEINDAYQQARDAIDDGEVAIISGMPGTGKSSIIKRLYKSSDTTPLLVDFRDPHDAMLALILSRSMGEEIILADEATNEAKEEPQRLTEHISNGLIVCSGIPQSSRNIARSSLVLAYGNTNTQSVDLGDIQTSHVEQDRYSGLLASLGFECGLIDILVENDPFRNPRFIGVFISLVAKKGLTTLDKFLEHFERTISPYAATVTREQRESVAMSLSFRHLPIPGQHAFFFAPGFHTYKEGKEVYETLGFNTPTDQEISEVYSNSDAPELYNPLRKS